MAFPHTSPAQQSALIPKRTLNSVLVDILDHLKSKVMEMQPPALAGVSITVCDVISILAFFKKMSNNCEGLVQENEGESGPLYIVISSEMTELSTDESLYLYVRHCCI